MYLTEPKLLDIVKKQFRFKLNASGAAFTTLIILQIITSFPGFSGTRYYPDFGEFPNIQFITTSNDGPVGVTIFWALFLGVMLTSNARQNESFTFVANRISHHLSNLGFMLTAAVISGFTVVLTGSAIKLLTFFRYGEVMVNTPGLLASPGDFLLRLVTAIAYIALFFLIGYTIGSLLQQKVWFIPLLIIGWMLYSTTFITGYRLLDLGRIASFFANEYIVALFLLKISGTIIALFAFSVAITNRLEVRKR